MTAQTPDTAAPTDDNAIMAERREKLAALRAAQAAGGAVAFPNDFKPTHRAAELFERFDAFDKESLAAAEKVTVKIAGRMMLKRVMGKAAFATLQDGSLAEAGKPGADGRIQIYVTIQDTGEAAFEAFKHWDLGDIIAAEGYVFKTKVGELSVHATSIRLLTKNIRPLPDKFHGVADVELKYRQRYVDLITDADARRRFVKRSQVLNAMRAFMTQHGFMEVETPMLHPIPGGANARPFVTHHNALDQDMYLRIAPELYLKRLIVGGFERVFEINRSFRNEGVSVRHNPEFTMMEFYAAYWNYRDLMDFTEELLREVATAASGSPKLSYGGKTIDLSQRFARMTIVEALLAHTDVGDSVYDQRAMVLRTAAALASSPAKQADLEEELEAKSLAALQVMLFEALVEDKLIQPTFIMEHPTEISPLARANDARPEVTERFELYITGREVANGFSELNDAEDQAARFRAQADAKDSGDDEAMFYDADYVRALEYGMPPTGGCGIGIDRLLMLLTDSASIRDVLLFPALKKEVF